MDCHALCLSREHVQEYIDFVRTVLKEADQLDHYAAHLCATARNMIELFHVIYASLHEKKAQELPYLAGKIEKKAMITSSI